MHCGTGGEFVGVWRAGRHKLAQMLLLLMKPVADGVSLCADASATASFPAIKPPAMDSVTLKHLHHQHFQPQQHSIHCNCCRSLPLVTLPCCCSALLVFCPAGVLAFAHAA